MKAINICHSMPRTYYLAVMREATKEEMERAAQVSYPPYVNSDGKCFKWASDPICLDDLLHTVWSDMYDYLKISGRKPDGWDWNGDPFYVIDEAEYDRILLLNKRKPLEKEFADTEKLYHRLLDLKESGKLLTEKERKQKRREYDLAFNEGGEGYNPYSYAETIEEYNYWEARYNNLKKQLEIL